MKNSEVAALILIASVSVLIAYFVAGAVIGKPSGEATTVKTMAPIDATVPTPDQSIFNKGAINPTIDVEIGNGQTP